MGRPQNMLHLGVLAISTFLGMVTGAVPSDCCRQKTVGDKMYELVGLEDTSQYNCLQHCVYREMMEQRSENRFCFAAGDMEVVCKEQEEGAEETEETEETEGTEQNRTEEPAPAGETGGGNGGGDCSYPADHTMTVYPGPADECGYELKFTGLDEATKKILLDKHNELRQKVASGGEAGQPGAANMRKLVWDDELATIAQRWTSQCIFEHDKVRDLCDGTVVGQNAYQSGTDYEYYDYNVNPEIGDAVQSWYDEVTNPGFSSANINPFVFDEGYGHYTAVVWADTDRVGCGRVYYEDTDGWFKHLVVCNYAIAANLEGGVMYEEGDKCSNCPAGYSCDATYDGLCAKN